jgi:hypothetical protein
MSEYIFPFEKLDVWQMAVDLAEYVLDLLEGFPPNKHLRLVGQMEAAVTSPAQGISGQTCFRQVAIYRFYPIPIIPVSK